MKDEGRKEIRILLQILKGTQVKLLIGESFSTEKLIQLAVMHRVGYQLLLYAQNHPGIFTSNQIERLSSRCRRNALRSLDQLHELKRVTRCLDEAGVSVVVIKGPQLANMLYGREALKESVDLDLMLLHESGLGQAHMLLTGLGYTQSNLNSHYGNISRKIFLIAKREVYYYNPGKGCHIDLHIRPGSNTYLTAGLFRNFFSSLDVYDLEGFSVHVPPPELYLVYLCYHGGLHQFSRLGWLMDIRIFLTQKQDVLVYEKVVALAREIHAERSLFIALLLLNSLFGDAIPVPMEKFIPRNRLMDFLVKNCIRMLSRESGYGLTLQGRAGKLIYMMILIRGFAGRVDLFYGILMRAISDLIMSSKTTR